MARCLQVSTCLLGVGHRATVAVMPHTMCMSRRGKHWNGARGPPEAKRVNAAGGSAML